MSAELDKSDDRGVVTYRLFGPGGRDVRSERPGSFGGHRRSKIYGRLDCRTALAAIARGGYVEHRVFFATETDALAAGYRPCGVCLPVEYARWRAERHAAACSR